MSTKENPGAGDAGAVSQVSYANGTLTKQIATEQGTVLALRAALQALRARYDSGAVTPAVWQVIRELESELAWLQHQGSGGSAPMVTSAARSRFDRSVKPTVAPIERVRVAIKGGAP
jgi:hypothetical protein